MLYLWSLTSTSSTSLGAAITLPTYLRMSCKERGGKEEEGGSLREEGPMNRITIESFSQD